MTRPDPDTLLDAAAFRRFVNTVGVVAVVHQGHVLAMTAEWCTPVSIEPHLVGVYVGTARFTETGMEEARMFGLSLLSDEQADLSHVLGSVSGWDVDKESLWDERRVMGTRLPVPLVKGASAHYECDVVTSHRVGDHVLWVGRPVAARLAGPDAPLLYHGGRYFRLGAQVPKPDEMMKQGREDPPTR